MMHKQNKNFKKEVKYLKGPNTNHGAEEYNNLTKILEKWIQHQTRLINSKTGH